MDTIRTLAEQRHFHTAEIELTGYGRVLVIGDQTAVGHIRDLIAGDEGHDLIDISDEKNERRDG